MGIAGHTPNFTAAGTILPFSCVKSDTSNPFRLLVATAENDVVLGVTDGSTRAFDSVNHAVAGDLVVLQNSEFVQLRAGGTIAIGDGLRPSTNGSVVTSTSRIQFVACDSAVSGEVFWAQRVGSVEPSLPGPSVFGSRRASQFLSDLASGADSLDVVIVGDSNTGSALQDMWGYHAGFSQTFMDRGYVCYGTPVLPVMLDGSDRAILSWRFWNYTFAPTGSLLSGNASGGATAYSVWTPGTDFVRYGTTTSSPISRDSWAYISSSTQYFQQFGLSLAQSHPLNAAGTRYYRVRSGTFTSGSGGYCARVNFDGTGAPSPVIATRVASNTGSAYGFVATDLAFTTNGVYTPRGAWSSVDSSGGITNGPLAIHSHSMYARRKGWSVTAHGYLAGYTSTQIASVISGAGSTLLQTHLQELRERQILGGGTGRVLLVVHSGMNGNDTVATWQAAHLSIWNTYKAAWVALGYPLSDLAIVSFCSHVPSATDTAPSGTTGNLAAIRAASGAFASANPDMTIMDVSKLLSFNQLVSGVSLIPGSGATPNFPTQRSYYQRYNNLPIAGSNIVVHLSGGFYVSQTTFDTSDGYTTLSSLIVTALLSAA